MSALNTHVYTQLLQLVLGRKSKRIVAIGFEIHVACDKNENDRNSNISY